MAQGDTWRVTATELVVRSGLGFQNDKVGMLSKGDIITETNSRDLEGTIWIQFKDGWCCGTFLEPYTEEEVVVTTTTENSPEPTTEEINETDGIGYQPVTDGFFESTNSNIDDSDFANINNIAGVFGLPYQFLPNTDLRLSDSKNVKNIGFEYAEKIIERIPLLFLAPGKASFMTKYSKANKQNILEQFINNGLGVATGPLEDLLSKDGRYYTFEYDAKRYYSFVNPMCRIAARYLNVHDVVVDGERLDMINWERFTTSRIRSIGDFGDYNSVPFYVNADTSISESFSNSTTQSMLASGINQISDYGRELNFLLGGTAAATGIETLQTDPDVGKNIENIQNTISKLLGKGNFLSNLASHLGTVAAGGKLIFPEIWSDSSFSRSYSCELKFIAPDPSNLSVYLNVIVPLLHLIGLVAPQSIKDNPNSYSNPFLVRAIYKGLFNVDMGIITGMSVTKGAECQWTTEGIPTSITVNIDIKDLYSWMTITATKNSDWSYDTLNNTALMDYIANLCGANIYKPEIHRIVDLWLMNNFTNRVADFIQRDLNVWGGVKKRIQKLVMNIYR